MTSVCEQRHEMLLGVLDGRAAGCVGIVIVKHAEVAAGFRPDVIRLRGMDVRVVTAGCSEHVVIGVGVCNLLADVLGHVINLRPGSSVDEAVNKWSVGIHINLLYAAGELVRGLRPVVILHRNDEDGLDLLGVRAKSTRNRKRADAQKV